MDLDNEASPKLQSNHVKERCRFHKVILETYSKGRKFLPLENHFFSRVRGGTDMLNQIIEFLNNKEIIKK